MTDWHNWNHPSCVKWDVGPYTFLIYSHITDRKVWSRYLAACVSWFLAFGAAGSTRSDFVAIRNRLLTIETLRSPVTICDCVFVSWVTPAISRPPSMKSSYARLKRPDAGATRRWASSGAAAAVTTSVVAWFRSTARELRFCCTSWKLRPPWRNCSRNVQPD